jgi:hypothetical protein
MVHLLMAYILSDSQPVIIDMIYECEVCRIQYTAFFVNITLLLLKDELHNVP